MRKPSDNDTAKKLNEVLSGIEPAKLKKGLETFKKLASSENADSIKEQLKNIDKEKLLNMFHNMDTEEIKAKLNKVNLDNVNLKENQDLLKKFQK